MTHFIPNETIIVEPRISPRITKPIKTMLHKVDFLNFQTTRL